MSNSRDREATMLSQLAEAYRIYSNNGSNQLTEREAGLGGMYFTGCFNDQRKFNAVLEIIARGLESKNDDIKQNAKAASLLFERRVFK